MTIAGFAQVDADEASAITASPAPKARQQLAAVFLEQSRPRVDIVIKDFQVDPSAIDLSDSDQSEESHEKERAETNSTASSGLKVRLIQPEGEEPESEVKPLQGLHLCEVKPLQGLHLCGVKEEETGSVGSQEDGMRVTVVEPTQEGEEVMPERTGKKKSRRHFFDFFRRNKKGKASGKDRK